MMTEKLSREQKLALLDAIEEKKKRLKRARPLYTPNPGQLPVHQAPARIRFVASANGAGKTALAVMESYWAATGTHPHRRNLDVPLTIIVLLDAPDKVERWIDEYKKWFDTEDWKFLKHGRPYITELVLPNGSNIKFMFHLQEPLAFESIELDVLIADEPFPRRIWVALQRGMRRKTGAWSLLVGTPIGQPWMYKYLWQPAVRKERSDIAIFKTGIEVNKKNLGEEFIDNFQKELHDHERKVRLKGDWEHFEGLGLPEFDREIHLIEPFEWPRGWPVVLGLDPHPVKGHAAVLYGVDKYGFKYVIKELVSHSAPDDFVQELDRFMQGFKVYDQVCDSLGNQKGWEKFKFIDKINEISNLDGYKVRLRATTAKDKSNDLWVDDLRNDLKPHKGLDGVKRPKLRIFNTCTGLIDDFESVAWEKYRGQDQFKPTLDIRDTDYLAAFKYARATGLCYTERSRVVTRPVPTTYGRRR